MFNVNIVTKTSNSYQYTCLYTTNSKALIYNDD